MGELPNRINVYAKKKGEKYKGVSYEANRYIHIHNISDTGKKVKHKKRQHTAA
jgi:hypothetical protein